MSAQTATLIGLGFAAFWLWLGASALPMPWSMIVGGIGGAAVVAILLTKLRRTSASADGFDRNRYRIVVAVEFAALALLSWGLASAGLQHLLWPAAGIVIGLHFIGLWWASGQRRFLTLAALMTTANAIALVVPPEAMSAASGLGSFAALAGTIALS